jgi:hypothetical protein
MTISQTELALPATDVAHQENNGTGMHIPQQEESQ